MSDVRLSDLLCDVGGHGYSRYGTATRRVNRIGRGGEEFQETFSRTGTAYWTTADGVLLPAASGVMRASWEPTSNVHAAVPSNLLSLRVGPGGTNLVPWDSDFSHWTVAAGTPTLTGGQSDPFGGTTAYNIDGGSGAAIKVTTAAFTGDGKKATSLFVRQGNFPPSGGTGIVVFDTTAGGVARMLATITWAVGFPTVVANIGAVLAVIPYFDFAHPPAGGGWWRVLLQTTSALVAANTNQVWIENISGSGDVFACGVMAQNALVPSTVVRTSGASATQNTESLTVPFSVDPQSLTIYVRHLDLGGWTVGGGLPRVISIGSTDTGSPPCLTITNNGGWEAQYNDGAGSVQISQVSAQTSYGDLIDSLVTLQLNADGSGGVLTYGQTVNNGVFTSGTPSAGGLVTPITAWSSPTVILGGGTPATAIGRCIIAAGIHTLAEMQAIL